VTFPSWSESIPVITPPSNSTCFVGWSATLVGLLDPGMRLVTDGSAELNHSSSTCGSPVP